MASLTPSRARLEKPGPDSGNEGELKMEEKTTNAGAESAAAGHGCFICNVALPLMERYSLSESTNDHFPQRARRVPEGDSQPHRFAHRPPVAS